jgi:hypothetical protein
MIYGVIAFWARGKGICPRPKAEMQHVTSKWIIALSKRERKA